MLLSVFISSYACAASPNHLERDASPSRAGQAAAVFRCFSRSRPLPCLTRALTSLPAVLTSGLCYPAGPPASEDRSSSASARAFISDLMTNIWCSCSSARLVVVWDMLGREEDDDELIVSSQGHCMQQSSPACTHDVHYGRWEKASYKGLERSGISSPSTLQRGRQSPGHARPRYTKLWLQGLLDTEETPTFPHKWTGFIS